MLAADRGYVALLRLRGARPLWLWVSLARLACGVLPLSLVLLLTGRRHSYAEAGAAVAVFGLAAGLLSPARARLVDRVGALGRWSLWPFFWLQRWSGSGSRPPQPHRSGCC